MSAPIIHEYWKYAACISTASYYDKHSHKCRYCATQQNKNWLQTNNENYKVNTFSNYLTQCYLQHPHRPMLFALIVLRSSSDNPRFGQIRSLHGKQTTKRTVRRWDVAGLCIQSTSLALRPQLQTPSMVHLQVEGVINLLYPVWCACWPMRCLHS